MVLRLAPGDEVVLIGTAGLAPAKVSLAQKNPLRLGVVLVGSWRQAKASGPRLALALIQSQRFDWAVEKAVELGASALMPLVTERTKSGEARPGQGKQDRWMRLAEEARKQCGRSTPLEIFPPLTLPELVAQPGPGVFLHPTGAPPSPGPELASPLIAIGPEGGFSPSEIEFLTQAGFKPWSLGPIILRAETAALAALAVISCAQQPTEE